MVGQMLVLSFIYSRSIYDIYVLNNMENNDLQSYYLEETSGENLGKVFDELKSEKCQIEIIKKPVTDDHIIRYEIYDTDNVIVNKIAPSTSEKQIIYLELGRNDFVDSTGVFRCNLSADQMRKISNRMMIEIKPYKEETVNYMQVLENNALNLGVLFVLSLFVLFVYTYQRIKVNAIKKMLGYSGMRMVKESLSDFLKIELWALAITGIVQVITTILRRGLCTEFFVGLSIYSVVVIVTNIILLFITQISIKSIDIGAMIKNKVYTNAWNTLLYLFKTTFIIILTCVISVFSNYYTQLQQKEDKLNQYRNLNKYFTSNGCNSDEYDKVFSDAGRVQGISRKMKQLYSGNKKQILTMNINLEDLLNDNYLSLHNETEMDLMNSYEDNFAVLNKAYIIKKCGTLYDYNGEKIDVNSLGKGTILIPEMYKGKSVENYCRQQYLDMVNYDEFNNVKNKRKSDMNNTIIYIKNNQKIEMLMPDFDKAETEIKNSIIYLDSGEYGGTWYLDMLSNGKIAFLSDSRDLFSLQLKKVGLDKLINVGTLLTPVSDELNYYQFICQQAVMFIVLFAVTLLFVLYLSNYTGIMINRKQSAIKCLLGYSSWRVLEQDVILRAMLLLLVIPMISLKIKISIFLISIVLDYVFLCILFHRIIK